MYTSSIAVRLTRRQIRALRFGHTLPPDDAAKVKASKLKPVVKLQPKPTEGVLWDPVLGLRLWNVGLFGPDHTFRYGQLIWALGRPVLDYRR